MLTVRLYVECNLSNRPRRLNELSVCIEDGADGGGLNAVIKIVGTRI